MKKTGKARHFWNHLRYYLSVVLLAFYLIIGILFLFTNTWIDFLPSGRIVIGIVLILFGALRFYIAFRRFTSKKIRLNEKYKAKQADPAN